jgi:hypothetical protein
MAVVCVTLTLLVMISCGYVGVLLPFTASGAGDMELVRSYEFAPNASVVIAGAWRHPGVGLQRGALSRAFRNRILKGLRVAADLQIHNVIFTGGAWDAIDARRWALEEFATSSVNLTALMTTEPMVADLTLRLSGDMEDEDDDEVAMSAHASSDAAGEEDSHVVAAANAGSDIGVVLRTLEGMRLWVENVSTTTSSNAIETAKIVNRHLEGGEVVVVSSGYHLPRCRVLFRKHLGRRQVFTIGTQASEFEVVLPSRWWIWIDFMHTAAPKNSSQSRPVVTKSPTSASGVHVSTENRSLVGFGNETPVSPATTGDKEARGDDSQRDVTVTRTMDDGVVEDKGAEGQNKNLPPQQPQPPGAVYSVTFHPIAYVFPTWVIRLAHSIAVSSVHWMSHVRCTLWSIGFFSRVRDAVAFVVNLFQNKFDLNDALTLGGS